MQPEAWKQIGEFLKSTVPLIGVFGGLFVGAILTRSAERKKWLNDCRKDEFKELLTTLTGASMALISEYDGGRAARIYFRPEDVWEPHDSYMKSLRVLKDRIFIADDLEKLKVFERWTEAMKVLISRL
jgi:hypothetical protein